MSRYRLGVELKLGLDVRGDGFVGISVGLGLAGTISMCVCRKKIIFRILYKLNPSVNQSLLTHPIKPGAFFEVGEEDLF